MSKEENWKTQIKALEATIRVIREDASKDREALRALKLELEEKDKVIANARAILELVDRMIPYESWRSRREPEPIVATSSMFTVAARVAAFRELLGAAQANSNTDLLKAADLERKYESLKDEFGKLLTNRNEWRKKARAFHRELRICTKKEQEGT